MGGATSTPEGTERESDSFDACFDAHHAEVLAFALRRLGDRQLAEDVLAETFAVAWRRRGVVPEPTLPWLYAIARRVIAYQARTARRQSRLRARLSAERRADGRDPLEAIAERDAVLAALAALPERQREVLMLVAWEGLDARGAAVALGCTTAAFRVRLHRARRALAKHLEASGHEQVGEGWASPTEEGR